MKYPTLPSKVYDYMKWILVIVIPALTKLILNLGDIWGFDPLKVTDTMSSVAVFLGVIFGISCYFYSQKGTEEMTDEEALEYIRDHPEIEEELIAIEDEGNEEEGEENE